MDDSIVGKGPLANLHFGHNETLFPLTALLGIREVATPAQDGTSYSWESNPWNSAKYLPMASNIQWEIYLNKFWKILIRMLLNERPIHVLALHNFAKFSP